MGLSILNKLFLIILSAIVSTQLFANELTLQAAEEFALSSDLTIKKLEVTAEKYDELAVAEGQLPDPVMKFGMMNLPINSFDRSQEPMTQVQVGIQQSFPRGDTLELRQEKTGHYADIDAARARLQARNVLLSVRSNYLDVYLSQETEKLLLENRDLFSQLLEVTERQYAVGRDNQHDVLRAQLELSLVDDRLVEVQGKHAMTLAELKRWLGNSIQFDRVSDNFPFLTPIRDLQQLVQELPRHPRIQIEDAMIAVNEKDINLAEQQYKPGWMLDLTYGNRSGNNLDGSSRDDFASAMILVDLPIFTNKRQDKRLSASKLDHAASQFARSDRLLEFRQSLEKEYANWIRLGKRLELYETRAMVDAEQNSSSTLKAYQNDLTDFTTLMRARLTELNTQLDMLKIRVDRAKSQANLLYYVRETI
ncbi:MAG: TolC family protein [Gammaproteobacteria bacterium]